MSGLRAVATVAAAVTAVSVVLSACSGSTPSAHQNPPTTTSTTTAVSTAAACSPSSVSAAVDITKFAGTSTSEAGAVVFRDTGTAPCALHGVPQVQVVGSGGQPLSTYQAHGPAHVVTAVLTPAAPSGTGAEAAASVTFSSWYCPPGSFSLSVTFSGWPGPLSAASGPAGGTCTTSGESDQTLYVGPVTPVAG